MLVCSLSAYLSVPRNQEFIQERLDILNEVLEKIRKWDQQGKFRFDEYFKHKICGIALGGSIPKDTAISSKLKQFWHKKFLGRLSCMTWLIENSDFDVVLLYEWPKAGHGVKQFTENFSRILEKVYQCFADLDPKGKKPEEMGGLKSQFQFRITCICMMIKLSWNIIKIPKFL